MRRLGKAERRKVEKAFEALPRDDPRVQAATTATLFYDVRDVVGKSGFGIGSAGLPAYNVLVEGYSQSLDNDVVLSMKQANVPGGEPVRRHRRRWTATSTTRGTAPWSASARCRCTPTRCSATPASTASGTSSSEVSPYEFDLDWGEINEPDEMAQRGAGPAGRATAKVHCASDEDSDQDLVDFQTEEAIAAVVEGRRREFVADLTDFAIDYAARVREDHALFVDAFREGRIGGVSAT